MEMEVVDMSQTHNYSSPRPPSASPPAPPPPTPIPTSSIRNPAPSGRPHPPDVRLGAVDLLHVRDRLEEESDDGDRLREADARAVLERHI
eukprot:8001083-Pyramimonas_sp.AAC.1